MIALFGLLPFAVILGAFVLSAAFFLFQKLESAEIAEILISMGAIWLVVILVLIFVTQICMSISPVERFASGSIIEAETEICALVADVKEFIESDNGQRGQDDPAINTAAIQDAMSSVGEPITSCPPSADLSGNMDRIRVAQLTLDRFIGPQLKRTFDKSMNCKITETFVSLTSEEPTLEKVQQTIRDLKSRYLDPIRQKQKDLRAGIISDCEKDKGAFAAVKQ